ncbi:MAG: HAMP domain-containing sensor histidine kinase [Gemmataceae bacterium]
MYQSFVGHELLNELVAAQGLARLLGEIANELTEEHRSLLTRLADRLQAVDHQARQVAEVGRLLREAAYGPSWSVEPMLQETQTQLSALSATNGMKYNVAITAIKVSVCNRWLRRVLQELLDNARQAVGSSRDGCIAVELSMQQERCLLSVRDNGIGFAEKDRMSILTPFQPGRRFHSRGIGLGFFLIRQILPRWRGCLRIDSIPGDTCVSVEFAPTEET